MTRKEIRFTMFTYFINNINKKALKKDLNLDIRIFYNKNFKSYCTFYTCDWISFYTAFKKNLTNKEKRFLSQNYRYLYDLCTYKNTPNYKYLEKPKMIKNFSTNRIKDTNFHKLALKNNYKLI